MRLVALSLVISLFVPLSGCLKVSGPNGAVQPAEPEVVFQPEPGLTSRERLLKAVGLLEVGEAAHAKVELEAYLLEEPKGKLANRLLPQIGADPQKFFRKAHGSESFFYTMKAGDSLSTVAKKFLGDAMLFHALARYNNIPNPRAMKAGQVIRIPGKPPAGFEQQAKPPAEPQPDQEAKLPPPEEIPRGTGEGEAPEEIPVDGDQPAVGPAPAEPEVAAPTEIESQIDTIQSMILEAQEMSAQGDFKSAAIHLEQGLEQYPGSDLIKGFAAANYLSFAEQLVAEGDLKRSNLALERSAELDPGNPEVKPRLAANYLALADRHIDAGRYGEALAALNKAEEFDPQNTEIEPRMANLERRIRADKMFTKGEGLREAGENIPAYDAFTKALGIDPGHVGAEKERALLVPVMVEHHYGEGVKALSRQDLNNALGFFDKALEINPNHGPAQRKRDQVLDLKKNLDAIPTE